DGDLPLDLAECDAVEGLLKQGACIYNRTECVDVEAAKRAEEELLLHDTRCWLNGGAMPEARHPRTGASALHVAAAKGYIEVMRIALDQIVGSKRPHSPLQLRNQKEASQSRGQEPQGPSSSKHRRSSVCRLSSREKISLQDLSKERRPGGAGGPPIRDEDEGEEGPSGEGLGTPDEAPFSTRFGLQKTGSSGALGPAERRGAEGAPGAGLQRSASSSRLEGTSTQAREPRLARITPTPSRKVPESSAPAPSGLPGPPETLKKQRRLQERPQSQRSRACKACTPEGGPSSRRQRDLNPEPEPESEEPDGGFRKLYAELRSENERLREALTETTLQLAQLKVELERATQRQERFAERPALLELER
ncbi:hypothetical protein E2I00_009762, partial [Balaenoptera physalus]